MRVYLSEFLAAAGWTAWAVQLRRFRQQRKLGREWWESYRDRVNSVWIQYGPDRLGNRDQN